MLNSSITINDLYQSIDALNPIIIYIDNKKVWDDNNYDITPEDYYNIFTSDEIVTKFEVEFCQFHHSIISIHTRKEVN